MEEELLRNILEKLDSIETRLDALTNCTESTAEIAARIASTLADGEILPPDTGNSIREIVKRVEQQVWSLRKKRHEMD